MIEAKDRATQFAKELKALLKKWNTEIELEDISTHYDPEYVIKVYLDAIYTKDGDCVAEWTEINFGRNIPSD